MSDIAFVEVERICEECGAPARWMVQDFREVAPSSGEVYPFAEGEIHLFCGEHQRPARTAMRDGRVVDAIDAWAAWPGRKRVD